MFAPPPTPLVAAGGSLVVAAGLLFLGYLIADAVAGKADLDAPARWGLAFPAVAAFTFALMLAHMATRGAVFARPAVTRTVTVAVLAVLVALKVARRRSRPGVRAGEVAAAGTLVAIAVVVWGWPLTQSLPLPHNADIELWMGWASQLMNGEPEPTAPITGDIPNYYPWLYHSLVALVATFTPGHRAFHALGPLQLLQVCGAVLSLFALGRELTGRWFGGAFAALFGALMGGFGFFVARSPAVVVNPRAGDGRAALEFMGDLLFKRSYSFAFQNLAPPFPRDVSFALLAGLVLLLVVGLRRGSAHALLWGGAVLGLVGLAGAEAFLVGGLTAVLVALAPVGMGRVRAVASIVLPAAAVYSVWFVPLLLDYVRLGGFVNITAVGPVTLPPGAILVSWGIATPLALYGAGRLLRDLRRPEARVIVALIVSAAVLLLGASVVPRVLGEAFTTLGRHHRYWPLAHLGVALAGAVGAAGLVRRVPRALALAATAVVAALALASPLLASLAVADDVPPPPVLEASLRGDPSTYLNALSPTAFGRRCNAAVVEAHDLSVFSYTGYRLVLFVWRRGITNQARVRWADVYDRIPGDVARRAANRVLVMGEGGPRRWRRVARRYAVDLVMAPLERAASGAFPELPYRVASGGGSRFAVFRIRPCA